jgi:2-dehydropantoate 2-reductase
MHICIFGAGSLGSLFAAYLARGGMNVSIIARAPYSDAIKSRGLDVHRVFDDDAFHVDAIRVIENLAEIRDADFVILAVKAFDVEDVLKQLIAANIIDASRQSIGLLQNGLGVEAIARALLSDVPILRITTTSGAMIEEPGIVRHTGLGTVFFGFWDEVMVPGASDLLESLVEAFSNASLPAEICHDMHEKVWQKVIVNAGINPVGAIFKVPNGRILETPSLLAISDQLTDEAVAVAIEGGFITDFDGRAAVHGVMEDTMANRNSMLQDLEKGRMTEIDFINGAIARQGRELGVATPWNDAVIEILHGFHELETGHDTEL